MTGGRPGRRPPHPCHCQFRPSYLFRTYYLFRIVAGTKLEQFCSGTVEMERLGGQSLPKVPGYDIRPPVSDTELRAGGALDAGCRTCGGMGTLHLEAAGLGWSSGHYCVVKRHAGGLNCAPRQARLGRAGGRERRLPFERAASQPAIDANFKKAQTLVYKNGYAVTATLGPQLAAAPAGAAGPPVPEWTVPAVPAAEPAATCPAKLPKWIQYDKQCLRFLAYFVEEVPDSPAEAWRVRRVTILHYLEDDSQQVDEPREPNSGIMQVGARGWGWAESGGVDGRGGLEAVGRCGLVGTLCLPVPVGC